MIGGLMKTTSRFAIAAAAGVLLGGIALSPARAADLGGDCCADLEERVAELEATTARKGNRKVSLTISGQVNAGLLFWDDGDRTDVYVGDADEDAGSRFRFTGSATIDPDWSAGFIIELDVRSAKLTTVSQNSDDGSSDQTTMSDVALYLQSKRLGRVTWGLYDAAADGVAQVNLGGYTAGIENSGGTGNGFLLKPKGSLDNRLSLRTNTWGTYAINERDQGEINTIRYDSPSLHGFIVSASFGENDSVGVALRYAKEWNSIRVAAAVGWWSDTEENSDTCPTAGNTACSDSFSQDNWAGSASALHVPSGLFVTYATYQNGKQGNDNAAGAAFADDGDAHYVAVGVYKSWIPLGKTSVYGEYATADGYGTGGVASAAANNFAGGGFISDSDFEFWGAGIVQHIDAAALELYLHYRHMELDLTSSTGATQSFEDLDWILIGGRIKF